jgi:MICOS complex subunit MIC12
VTVTLGLAYLTVLAHERNRQSQALYLRSQSQLLNSLIDPAPVQQPTRAEITRQSRETFVETAKDRWNGEIENAIRWVQTTDWNGVREGMEGAVARMLGLGLEKSREGIEDTEKKVKPMVQEAVDRSRAAASRGAEQAAATIVDAVDRAPEAARSGAEKVAASTREGLNQAGTKAQEIASATKASATKAAADVKAGADRATASTRDAMERGTEKSHEVVEKVRTEAQSTGAGTVDAARGALRNVISKGMEKGKEVIDKAQAAIGLATEKVESASPSIGSGLGISDVEKALRERYEKPTGLNRTVEEALEERYKPIDERDNTVLRGV